MKKLVIGVFALLLISFFSSCIIRDSILKLPREGPELEIYQSHLYEPLNWNLYVFDIKSDQYYGRAFIANYHVYTASHIFEENFESDIKNLGLSPIMGLEICSECHGSGDLFSYQVNGITKYLYCVSFNDTTYFTVNMKKIVPGDSGSPVFCTHGKVIGLVSAYTFVGEDGNGGIITKIQ